MAKGIYLGVNNVARKVPKAYVGVNGIARKVTKGYIGIGGVARPFYSPEAKLIYYGAITALSSGRTNVAGANNNSYALMIGGHSGSGSLNTVNAYNTSLVRTNTTITDIGESLATARIGVYAIATLPEASTTGDIYVSGFGGNAWNATLVRSDITVTSTRHRSRGGGASNSAYAMFGGGESGSGTSWTYRNYGDAFNASLTRTTFTLSLARSNLRGTDSGDYGIFGGGGDASQTYSTVDAFNAALTRTTTALSTYMENHASTKAGNFGLFGGYQTNSTVDAFNSLVRTTTSLSQARRNIAAGGASVGTFGLFGGGQTSNQSTSRVTTVDAFNSSLVRTIFNLSVARARTAGASISNFGLFGGGAAGSDHLAVVDAFQYVA